MKYKLTDVLELGGAMRQIETKIAFDVRGTLRWSRARKAVMEHFDPFLEQVLSRVPKENRTVQNVNRAEEEVTREIDGEEVDLVLPAAIPAQSIQKLDCKSPEDYVALSCLSGVVLSDDDEPRPAP